MSFLENMSCAINLHTDVYVLYSKYVDTGGGGPIVEIAKQIAKYEDKGSLANQAEVTLSKENPVSQRS
jgi:hypothetical protein